ncbi:TLC ATP/ADP transporter [Striga asiatica]|uniref:TLC ATP/ADP transporter n=1 Tax=Striga asiatica TaxID=4170 RepID=A0A5A7R2B2_STRAF|nr:TLC ATP/ADP transporter [Striga asiatica]
MANPKNLVHAFPTLLFVALVVSGHTSARPLDGDNVRVITPDEKKNTPQVDSPVILSYDRNYKVSVKPEEQPVVVQSPAEIKHVDPENLPHVIPSNPDEKKNAPSVDIPIVILSNDKKERAVQEKIPIVIPSLGGKGASEKLPVVIPSFGGKASGGASEKLPVVIPSSGGKASKASEKLPVVIPSGKKPLPPPSALSPGTNGGSY